MRPPPPSPTPPPHASGAATEIGEHARELLVSVYGNADWIEQAVSVVRLAFDRAVSQLSRSQVSKNEAPLADGAQYAFPARSKEEILETPAANEGHVPPTGKIKDPRYRQLRNDTISKKRPQASNGAWLL